MFACLCVFACVCECACARAHVLVCVGVGGWRLGAFRSLQTKLPFGTNSIYTWNARLDEKATKEINLVHSKELILGDVVEPLLSKQLYTVCVCLSVLTLMYSPG